MFSKINNLIVDFSCCRYRDIDLLRKDMEGAGFKTTSRIGLISALFLKRMYEKEGLFTEKWRQYDRLECVSSASWSITCVYYSAWSLASKEELEAGLAKWRRMLEGGTADQFIAEREEQRKRVGLSTSVTAYKDCD